MVNLVIHEELDDFTFYFLDLHPIWVAPYVDEPCLYGINVDGLVSNEFS